MAQQSKFSGALAALRSTPEPETPAEPPAATAAPPPVTNEAPPPRPAAPRKAAVREPEPPKGRGRPPGKRSDPDFKPTTLFLRTVTKRTATRLLEDKGEGQDLSELVEQLLAQWNKRNA